MLAYIKKYNLILPVRTISWNDDGELLSVTAVTDTHLLILARGEYELIRVTECRDRWSKVIKEYDVLKDANGNIFVLKWDVNCQKFMLEDEYGCSIGLSKKITAKMTVVGNTKIDRQTGIKKA